MNQAAPTPGRNMGQPIPRYEARSKVTGAARYATDFPMVDPLHAFMVTSPIARGSIKDIDDRDARAVPGVVDVLTYRNRPPIRTIDYPADGIHGHERVPGLAGPEIRYEGEFVAMVLAETYEAAREAAFKVVATYDREAPASGFDSDGLQVEAVKNVFPKRQDPMLGDAKAAFVSAPVKVEADYTTPPQHHVAIELYSSTVSWISDEVVVHESAQVVYALKNTLAQALGIPPANVRVISPFVGGGFGAKAAMTRRTALAAVASRKHGRPVKIVQTRDQGFQLGHRPEARNHIQLGADRQGRLLAYSHDLLEITARNDPFVPPGGIGANAATYLFPTVATTRRLARADRNPPMAMRAPSEVTLMFALESAMDELAIALKIDPVELRRINDTDRDMVSGKPFTSRSLMRCYDEAATAFGWSRRDPRPRSMTNGDWLVGWGCATSHYPTSATNAVVRVRLSRDGAAVLQTSGSDLGTGAYTVFSQEVALCLGVAVDRIRVEMGDSTLPPGPIAGGSAGSASGCSAIRLACDAILQRLRLKATADAKARQAAFERLGVGEVEAQGDFIPAGVKPQSTASAYDGSPAFIGGEAAPKAQFAFGAQFVEVRVHRHTREIRVPRMVGAFAAGRILNPRTAHSQLMGGMIWGLSSALLEATELDRREARYINDNLAEYLIPVNADIRDVDVIFVPEVDDECNPAGVKGLGELGNVGMDAAIANAVYHATGVRIRDLPITIDKLLTA